MVHPAPEEIVQNIVKMVEKRIEARNGLKTLNGLVAKAHKALAAAKKMPQETAAEAIFAAQAKLDILGEKAKQAKNTAEKKFINKTIKMEAVSHNEKGLPPRKLSQVGFISGDSSQAIVDRAEEEMVCNDLIPIWMDDGVGLFKV